MKIGTIGSGFIVRTILSKVAVTDGMECKAVYSRSCETGKKLAQDFGVDKVYTDLDAVLRDPELDFIYVASPNSLHYDHVKRALEAGKNVLCEKPMVPYGHQAAELIALAKEKGLFLFEAITTLYHPHFQWIREHMEELGKLQMITASYCQYSSRYDILKAGGQTNIFDPAFCTGALMDINVYNIYFVVGLLGMPDRVEYYAGRFENGIDTHGTVILQYGDVVCQCIGAKDTLCDNGVQIMGDLGYMKVTPAPNNCQSVTLVRRSAEDAGPMGTNLKNRKNREEVSLPEDQWYYEMQTISRLVKEKDYETCYRNLESSLAVAKVLEAARKSAGLPF